MRDAHSGRLHWLTAAGTSYIPKYKTIVPAVRSVATAIVLAGIVACGGSDSAAVTGPPEPTTLSFALSQVNEQTLPATFQTADGVLVIGSGTFQLKPDKTFAENISYTFAATGSTAAPDNSITNGTYVQNGTDITFTVPPSGTDPGIVFGGTVSATTLSYNDAGFVAVYKR